jgi:hypothetical protein
VKKMAAAAAVSMGVVCEDFGFSFPYGDDIFNALGELLIDAGCVTDQDHC